MAWYDSLFSDRSHTTQPADLVTGKNVDYSTSDTLSSQSPTLAARERAKYSGGLGMESQFPGAYDLGGAIGKVGKFIGQSFANLPANLGFGQTQAPSAPIQHLPVETFAQHNAGGTQVTLPPPPTPTGTSSTSGGSLVVKPGTGNSTGDLTPAGATPTPIVKPKLPPEQPLKYEPITGAVPGGTWADAYKNPGSTGVNMVGSQFDQVQGAEQNVVDVRKAQPTNLTDLERSRGAEGYNDARAQLADVTRKVNDYNATVASVETQVRNEYANSNLTESEIQAEVTNRMRHLIPEGQRLEAQYNTAKSNYDIAVSATTERFNAVRADAAEAVNQVMQIYGFKKDNADLAINLMTGLKNYEVASDAQKNSQRDAARAYAVQAMSTPGMLQRMSAQDIANLERDAQFYPGSLAGVRDSLADGKLVVGQFDDYGNFVYVKQGANGSLSFGRKDGLARIAPKVSAASVAAQASWANSTPGYREYRMRVLSDLFNEGKAMNASQRYQAAFKAFTQLSQKATETGNPADYKDASSFMGFISGVSSELTQDKLDAEVAAILEQQAQ